MEKSKMGKVILKVWAYTVGVGLSIIGLAVIVWVGFLTVRAIIGDPSYVIKGLIFVIAVIAFLAFVAFTQYSFKVTFEDQNKQDKIKGEQ
jgi:cytochrome bd-type quinol oxidase subunit 1